MKHASGALEGAGLTLPLKRGRVKYPLLENLVERSPDDAPWDLHRAQADEVEGVYGEKEEFERYAKRMAECSGWLKFGLQADPDGVASIRLRKASFCRVRNCPVCQWRRSLLWKARFYKAMPDISHTHPTARWIFLTLTVKNVDVKDLRSTLQAMGKAWGRLVKRKEFGSVLGWVRTTEVTRGQDGSAHPHFHVLAMVSPSYFGKQYVTKNEWATAWQGAMNIDYLPVVDVQAVKDKKTGRAASNANPETLRGAVSETLKYAVKPSDMTADADWFYDLTRQTFRLRFIAAGGALKDLFKDEKSEQELLLAEQQADEQEDLAMLTYTWSQTAKHYQRKLTA